MTAAPQYVMNNTCETCGNTYDKPFEVHIGGTAHVFDSFQCAIQALAPRCTHCKVPIIGQGIEARGQYFCCAHCAREAGVADVADRAAGPGSAAT
ncbi:MAG TPA: hypothetical protein VGL61_23735 [Kofleriaceae bacterium]|jgi:hypothetical protein